MTISVCITAYDKDIYLLDRCLHYIKKQTLTPNQIILLASNINYWSGDIITDIFISNKLMSAGEARNQLLKISSSDIVCFCDIDDEVHPQKCEIVKHVFSKTGCCALVHDYEFGHNEFETIDTHQVKTYRITDADNNPNSTNLTCPISDGKIAHGPISVNREFILRNHLYYPNMSYGEDGMFCRNILRTDMSKILYTDSKLINYIS